MIESTTFEYVDEKRYASLHTVVTDSKNIGEDETSWHMILENESHELFDAAHKVFCDLHNFEVEQKKIWLKHGFEGVAEEFTEGNLPQIMQSIEDFAGQH